MTNILFISTRYPFSIFGGDKLRSSDIIRFLSKKNKIDLICINKTKKIKKNPIFCKNIKIFKINFFSKIINTIFSFLRLQPLQIGFYYSREMLNYINNIESKYDTIICHTSRSSQYLPKKFKGKKILEMSDLQSLNYEQSIKQLSFINPLKYLYIIERLLCIKYERKIFKKFDDIVFASNKDANIAKKKISYKKKLHVIKIAHKLNLNLFKFKKINNKIIFIGNLKYLPNKLACNDFVLNILKKINLKFPEIKLHLIGDISFLHKLYLNKFKNVIVHGKVNNLNKVLKNAICAICNVKISTGFQTKILTYMSYGIPTIVSTNSFEGVNLKKNKELLVYEKNSELIKKIFFLKENKNIANQLSFNSRKVIGKKYSSNKILSKYEEII